MSRFDPTEATDQTTDTFVFSSRGNALVNVQEDGECPVARPSFADDGVDSFSQPPGAGGVAQVVTAEPGKLRLERIVGTKIGAEGPES
jgi:hypothetical protein